MYMIGRVLKTIFYIQNLWESSFKYSLDLCIVQTQKKLRQMF